MPYAAPFLVYVALASIIGDSISPEVNYILRIIACSAVLVWAWKWYFPLTGPRSPIGSIGFGVLAGVIGVIVWIILLTPFAPTTDVDPWSNTSFVLRLAAAGLLVPFFEELMMRGFVFRLALQWSEARKMKEDEPLQVALDERTINDVRPGDWTWTAVIISTLVFVSGHQMYEWPAAIGFGLLMALLLIVRKDLLSCIVAHSTTNICLAFYVLKTDSWYLW
ncbi:CPBP family glutamic-type intramembrane protease [Desulfopila aestuarii]|uniref:CPBP family glutamic-type intramembrane protease n=1 Tax=Desulfopila aestuarii TaxID=231440 RepID=UPI001F231A07|nr:CPBP family glutamic-type intramembrane protease [Desulfopila aestuarii]